MSRLLEYRVPRDFSILALGLGYPREASGSTAFPVPSGLLVPPMKCLLAGITVQSRLRTPCSRPHN